MQLLCITNTVTRWGLCSQAPSLRPVQIWISLSQQAEHLCLVHGATEKEFAVSKSCVVGVSCLSHFQSMAWNYSREVFIDHWTQSVMLAVCICLSPVSVSKHLCRAAQQGVTSFSISVGCIDASFVGSFCFPCGSCSCLTAFKQSQC